MSRCGTSNREEYVLQDESLHLGRADGCDGFCLDPLCEKVDRDDEEPALACGGRKRPEDVDPSYVKWPRGFHWAHVLTRNVDAIGVLLALLASFHQCCGVPYDRGPVVPRDEHFAFECGRRLV